MVNILAIGNSFSQDATTYLHDLAKSGGIDTKVVNLYIGGCSLERHWNNIEHNKADYQYQLNGVEGEHYVTVEEILKEEEWDYIVTQQCSGYSGLMDTYYPYLGNLLAYVQTKCPNAKRVIMQTWAYEVDSTHEHFEFYHNSQEEMYKKLSECYDKVADEYRTDLIPAGDLIQSLRRKEPFLYLEGGKSLCRDGFHMHLLYGRYAVAALWFDHLLGGNIMENPYRPPVQDGKQMTEDEFHIIKNSIKEID
ncbi:DUF4886 domain-containing protein [Blautia liquoris]|uniref:DUF4886 domain-containing protein n=1 Tax=Blautia liquoris TaxID=2779518 RepID=A0A7M2RFM3_9FIRM|nr:DUF4886 domain-containing protein [Blautia liquoris]QOV19145.1 DUF4886 domain-containing protein [Blautia liquoris]